VVNIEVGASAVAQRAMADKLLFFATAAVKNIALTATTPSPQN